MKTINKNTLLRCGDKIFKTIEVDEVIYWENSHVKEGNFVYNHKTKKLEQANKDTYKWFNNFIIAQSKPKLQNVPVINLEPTGFDEFEYTQKDIDKVIELTIKKCNQLQKETYGDLEVNVDEISEQINSISVIEVDKDFNIISYE
jgi:hypothetical protein